MAAPRRRLAFHEAMEFVQIEGPGHEKDSPTRRYMSVRPAWVTGGDLPFKREDYGPGRRVPFNGTATYGGHVYAQAGLVAARAFEDVQAKRREEGGEGWDKQYGIHTVHGYFAEPGNADRPFIYEVSSLAANVGFHNILVTVKQPMHPSHNASHLNPDHGVPSFFPLTDSKLPLGPVCFTALVSFRPAGISQVKLQERPPQERFRDILASRPPETWEPAPASDIDSVRAQLSKDQRTEPGTFPGLQMHKVDMTEWNRGKALHERREVVMYRLLKPIPQINMTESERWDEEDRNRASWERRKGGGERRPASERDGRGSCSMHIMAHAYEADRNSLFMLGNHAGFGWDLGRAASLSYSFVVHVNPDDCLMEYSGGDDHHEYHGLQQHHDHHHLLHRRRHERDDMDETGLEQGQWWIQEVSFPRLEAGRGVVMSKLWSPKGVHVATEYQDGIIRRQWREGEREQKL